MSKVLVGILQAPTGDASFQSLVNTDRQLLVSYAIHLLGDLAKQYDFGIFAAPEYLFSNQNSNQPINLIGAGKYCARGITESQKEENVEWVKKLSVQFKNLLLIPGTMAWLKPFDRGSGIERHRAKGGQRGSRLDKARDILSDAKDAAKEKGFKPGFIGDTAYGGAKVPTSKEKMNMLSGIHSGRITDRVDILRNSLYLIWNNQVLHKYNKIADYHEVLNYENQKSLFIPGDSHRQTVELFSTDFGFEICLDHAYDMLDFDDTGSTPPVDLHILLSASVSTQQWDLKDGGLLIHASSDPDETSLIKDANGISAEVPELVDKAKKLSSGCSMRFFETDLNMKLQ